MTTTAGRSNKQGRILFIGENGTSHIERIYGGGFGAFAKMVDRAIVALTGWDALTTAVDFDNETHMVTFTHRTTGQSLRFTTAQEEAPAPRYVPVCTCPSRNGCEVCGPQPRERLVACLECQTPTAALDAVCDRHVMVVAK